MANVISLTDKQKHAQARQAAVIRKRKIRAIQRTLQCTHCASKCIKCGSQLAMERSSATTGRSERVPYRFCDACREEYLQYVEVLAGGGDSECFWHNHEWLDMWGRWIEYQGAMDRFMRSKEFMRLVYEMREAGPELPDL